MTTTKRNAALPDVPTVADTVPGYEASVFYGVAGPKGIPPHIVEILNKGFNAALATSVQAAPFIVRVALDNKDVANRLPAGSTGTAAIFTSRADIGRHLMLQ